MADNDDNATSQEPEKQANNFVAYTEETVESLGSDQQTEAKGEPEAKDTGDAKKPEEDSKKGGEEEKPRDQSGGRRLRGVEKRIGKYTKRAKEAETRAEKAERERDEALQRLNEIESKSTKPKRADHDTDEAYEAAVDAWFEKKQEKAPAKPKPDQARNDEFEDAFEDVKEAFDADKSNYEDFDEVIATEGLVISEQMVIELAETDDPTAIAYWLGKNTEESARIASMTPSRIAREFAKLEVKLASAPSQTTEKPNKSGETVKKTTKAPDPINPVKGSDVSEKSLNDMDFAEYEKKRNESRGQGFNPWR